MSDNRMKSSADYGMKYENMAKAISIMESIVLFIQSLEDSQKINP
jgi:hypothetical protein